MNLENYLQRRELFKKEDPKFRHLCVQCLQPEFGCYCSHIKSFDPKIKFVILIHPIEVRRRIATGRMSHLVLKNSELISGQDYTWNNRVNALLNDPQFQPMVLYPGIQSTNLTEISHEQRAALIKKRPLIFVIDGTWATAKKTMHQSKNLKTLPRICFTPPDKSQFRVRKQPGVDCYSTIEAIHHTIELVGSFSGFDISTGQHNSLLQVFNKMVERQLDFIRAAYEDPSVSSYRRPRHRIV